MKLLLYGIIVLLSFCVFHLQETVFATDASKDSPFVLIPKSKDPEFGSSVDKLTNPNRTKDFRSEYNRYADLYLGVNDSSTKFGCDLGGMLSSGIITRDTILCFLIRVVKFVANMALVVGAAMIIYAGYLYTITAISGSSVDETSQANDAIKNAAIGIVIVIFSYAIQRIVTQAFLS